MPVVCQVCVEGLSFSNTGLFTDTCPVPTCQKGNGKGKPVNRSIDGVDFVLNT